MAPIDLAEASCFSSSFFICLIIAIVFLSFEEILLKWFSRWDETCFSVSDKKPKLYFSSKELDLLQKAYNVAFEAHKDQFRQEGSPYITHPIAVAITLLDLHLDVETVCAGLMHDVLEDSVIKKSYLEK